MNTATWMKKAGATPGKLALVAVLAVVLIVVIVGQLPDRSEATNVTSTRKIPTTKHRQKHSRRAASIPTTLFDSKTKDPNKLTTSSSSEMPDRIWPELSMKKTLSYDPLALPVWLVEARNAAPPVDEATRLAEEALRRKRKEEIIRTLKEEGARAVVFAGAEKRVAIGEESLRVGETIEGLRIIDITRDGVVLSDSY